MIRRLSALLCWITIQMMNLESVIGTIVQWSERSVISKQWSARTLPLQCNSALVYVTILVDNMKTQLNYFVATC